MADLPCPTCGSNLTFLDQYQRYYCHRCLQYAPEGYGDRGAQRCPTCGGILSYVRQYGRMYCYHCNTYPAEAPAGPSATEPIATAAAPPEPAPPVTSAPIAEESTAAASVPSSSGTVLVAPPAPPSETPSEEPAPEEIKPEEPAPSTASETPEPEKGPEPSAPEEAPPAAPEPPVAAPPSREMQALAAQKPAAVRVKLFALKKPELVDLCAVYHLDTSGSKDQLQDRLLSHLHDLEAEPTSKTDTAPEELPSVESSAPPVRGSGLTASPPIPAPSVAASAPAVVVEEPHPAPAAVAAPTPVVAVAAPVTPETPRIVPRAERPCPTCGRELTFIAQYNRYYCYSCQRYAPAGARAKNACPTCGSTMRWIEQHRRWWCDSCAKYASADLPAPGASAERAVPMAQAALVARPIVVHRHGSPASGAGLVGFGVALYIVYAFFGFLGDALGFVRPAAITTQTLDALQFFAFLLVALGAIVGLYGVRHRE